MFHHHPRLVEIEERDVVVMLVQKNVKANSCYVFMFNLLIFGSDGLISINSTPPTLAKLRQAQRNSAPSPARQNF